jgi:hypothetical protein
MALTFLLCAVTLTPCVSMNVVSGRYPNRNQSRLDGWSLERRRALILLDKDRLPSIFRKMIRPGTTSLISVPEFEELMSVSLPPIRAVRSRIPRRPKCPSFPRSEIAGSIPVPLSSTRRVRSRAYLSSISNRLAPECVHALRMAS